MKYTMKNISLFTCSVLASIAMLSACAQTTVSVRPVNSTDRSPAKAVVGPAKRYEPISRTEPYVVQQGDTLYAISFRAGLSYREVANWNNIAEPYALSIGQHISLKPTEGVTPSNATVVKQPASETNISAIETKPIETIPTASPQVKPSVITPNPTVSTRVGIAPPSIAVEQPIAKVQIPIAASPVTIGWLWPSDGTVIAQYVQGDPTQQGINIGGKSGQPVKASADGTVVYSGAGLVGYGELIIIKHNNEWLSAYAHNRRRLVAEGSKVRAGDVIAEMGRTGTMRDMLHFEIRRNGKPVDPLLFLPKQ